MLELKHRVHVSLRLPADAGSSTLNTLPTELLWDVQADR